MKTEGHDTSKILCEVSESIWGEILRGLGILEDSLGFLGILEDSKGFFGVKIMGFLRIRGDSARILGDSQGFSGILQKPYEVSGVSSPWLKTILEVGGGRLCSCVPLSREGPNHVFTP